MVKVKEKYFKTIYKLAGMLLDVYAMIRFRFTAKNLEIIKLLFYNCKQLCRIKLEYTLT
jgi:hypothetical protein